MPRAIWKGWLAVGQLTCAVALHAAASTSDRVTFHTVNRRTGNRVRREFVDAVSGKPVPGEDQVKGYEVAPDEFVQLEPEEIAAAVPESDKRLEVASFVPCREVDGAYFDKPYYLTPAGAEAEEAFALIREGMKARKVAALARAVLFRRVRTMLIRPHGVGMIGNTLNFDYEVRSSEEAFADIPKLKIKGEMLDLAKHIIGTKAGRFDPGTFDDRYDAALAELVKSKLEGRKPRRRAAPKAAKPTDLLAALRESAAAAERRSRKAS
ncbi:Ku protein [Cereibacter sphaeroides]|uniref:non-homologous end joining protein Ku n=1 Tax=Cereibacter sphaeroides TaxID=1063 RepID=UPI001F2AE580|nr:Ku protein [Cereibacter sphaeroides]MCE6958189.1 Ku protein [Cereibacter sphaeroides]MCE6967668.1 Ku protein [Cereibacter sphaeroides]MCE6972479.1 Ku protein [Cereibacter sphaeroides]